MKRLKCCMYSSRHHYGEIAHELNMYIGDFDLEFQVEPWQLSYRYFDMYILDTWGARRSEYKPMMELLQNQIRTLRSRLFVTWNQQTQHQLSHFVQDSRPNLVYCGSPNWINTLTSALRTQARRRRDAK